jgi:uncharacterized protein (TIGR00251 family)
MLALQQHGTAVLLPVLVQPRASRNAVAGVHGQELKLLLSAPPVEGAANAACLDLLTDVLGVRRSQLSIIKGIKARHKVICIARISLGTVRTRLGSLFPDLAL